VDLYEDIGGKYLPRLAPGAASHYVERMGGRIELVTCDENGSRGTIVEDLRGQVVNRGTE
jgi:hypothetical protein